LFLVLGSARGTRRVDVFIDCRRRRPIRVTSHRLYEIVRLDTAGEHVVTLAAQPGTEAYAFTFG
jgi:hypothetical protein